MNDAGVSGTGDGSVTRDDSRSGLISAFVTLLASSSTLICCALPALLVALGAGAALSSLVSAVPQIVWISEHKEWVFGIATALMIVSWTMMWRNRHAPCPVNPKLRDACLRTRKFSARIYWVSVALLAIGGWFAFIQPLI
jgi:hypothetical protein